MDTPRGDAAPPALDVVVGHLVPSTPSRGVDQAAVTRRVLGLPDAADALPATR